MDAFKKCLPMLALGLIVFTGASTSDAQAPDPIFGVSRPAANFECCIVEQQYAEHSWCNMEIYHTRTCAPRGGDDRS